MVASFAAEENVSDADKIVSRLAPICQDVKLL